MGYHRRPRRPRGSQEQEEICKSFSSSKWSLFEASADEGYRQQVEDHRRRAQLCRRDGCQGEVPQESSATGANCGGSEACAETCLQHQKNQQGGLQRNLEENRSKGLSQ